MPRSGKESAGVVPGILVRIERASGILEGTVVALSDACVTVTQTTGHDVGLDVPWTDVARLSVRHGRPRSYALPVGLGLTGATIFGACGGVLDSLATPSSGTARSGLFASSAGVGLFLGGAVGLLIVFARRAPHWVSVLEAPDPERRGGEMTLAARLAEGRPAAVEESSRALAETLCAWLLLVVFLLGGWQWLRVYLGH